MRWRQCSSRRSSRSPHQRRLRPIVDAPFGRDGVEALAQAGAVAVLAEPENRGKLALFAGIDDVRFKRLVEPGDELTLTCDLEAVRGPIGRGRAVARVGDDLAVRGTLTFAAADLG